MSHALPVDEIFAAEADPRRARILQAAMGVFLAYGFQRTTMDDIARACEISRPALYLQFRNKTDIYRAIAQLFLAHVIGRAEALLDDESGNLAVRLNAAFGSLVDLIASVEDFPHGADMLDIKSSLAVDIMAQGRARLGARVAGTIAASAPHADAAAASDLLLDALDGMKMRQVPLDGQRRLLESYVAMVVAGLGRAG